MVIPIPWVETHGYSQCAPAGHTRECSVAETQEPDSSACSFRATAVLRTEIPVLAPDKGAP